MAGLAGTFGIAARNFTAYPEMPDARQLVDYGVRVEELGYDSVWVWDHMLLGVEPNFPIIDSLTVLTAIAAPEAAAEQTQLIHDARARGYNRIAGLAETVGQR